MRRSFFAVLFVAASSLASLPAAADPANQAIDAARAGDFTAALSILGPEVDRGDAHAQFVLGLLYESGIGVVQDSNRAAELYRQSAEQGLPTAANNLGSLYANGEGVPRDASQAVRWWQIAADKGLSTAQLNLADYYANIGEDLVQSYKWAALAAEQGEDEADGILAAIEPVMTPDQIKQARLLVDLWDKAPTQGA
jgi:TPR repeat protein